MILIALGSNLGDRAAYLGQARAALGAQGICISRQSTVIEVPALLPKDAPADWNRPFLNQVLEVHTDRTPHALLHALKDIERALGRHDHGHWAPREIDLDLIAYENGVIASPTLTVPHPRLHERDFVLKPIREIAPGWRHPKLNKTVEELLAQLHMPKLVAILNLTPDSFSGDGMVSTTAALQQFEALVAAGADIVDIGAESTRPGAVPLTHEMEWQRLEPVLKAVQRHPKRKFAAVSVDTRHAATAEKALKLGVNIINDVSGLTGNAMVAVLKQHDCPVIVMHALGLPADPAVTLPKDADPVQAVLAWKQEVKAKGIAPERLIYDPGIGFGKTAEQSFALLDRADELVASGGQWLFGHSRKSFMKLFSDVPAARRDPMTLAFSLNLAAHGVHYLRVHNISLHRAALAQAA